MVSNGYFVLYGGVMETGWKELTGWVSRFCGEERDDEFGGEEEGQGL